MLPSALFDLHCDTLLALSDQDFRLLADIRDPDRRSEALESLTQRVRNVNSLDLPGRAFSLSALPREVRWCQCCAIFIPDGLSQEEAVAFYDLHQRSFYRQMDAFEQAAPCRSAGDIQSAWEQGRTAAVLTVENGSALAGRLDRIEILARDGVRMLTLTWNGENEIGSGNTTQNGLSAFGKEAVRELEQHGIVVDVSHLNDNGFRDVLDTARKPFAASHSNARAVCGHPRNLTDDQIREMADRNCLIGLNFCKNFLRDGGGPETGLEDLFRHVEHFFQLGAEHCLALGSDADGADLPDVLNNSAKIAELQQFFLSRGLSRPQAEGILWKNAMNFVQKLDL